ncbi:Linoleate 10R-lipoxygenase [Tolypocladium capitatum]|uniref:Linoleate 10R-lipoxygenase n=1 Tax=Tolypocladium capitatum TaxID=45235 RepID=A0A2K3QIU9_9HYPO|nr:Linoleate 10R-lipoxygenase [Tolypocladium capitatum]
MSPDGESNGEGAQNGAHHQVQNGTHANGNGAHHQGQNGTHANGTRQNGVHGRSSDARTNVSQIMSSSQPKKSESWSLSQFRQASRRPLPTEMGDGSYRAVVKRPGLMQDLRSIGWGGKYLKTLKEIVAAKLKGETQVDDKTMIMERTIQLVATMPYHSPRQEVLTNSFIDTLWNSLSHPPLLYMGDQFRYRQPDGSNNNPLMPKMGAAGTPYSRTVKPGKATLGALPDPETVYEAVMARDGFKKNPNNVSSILWYWATIIIHDLFWTNSKDGNQNDSSSYLDLSPLYGNTKEALDSIRTFKDGMLKADSFADKRLVGNPPGVCIILVMFNRFHNYIAGNLASINEGNKYAKPPPNLSEEAAAAAWKKYDEELFQTARLVTSGLYINITLVDYVRNIINLNRVDSAWTLDPRQEMGVSVGTSDGAESGVGNVVSAEFNLCYRWHSCISEMDDEWIQNFYTQLLGENYGEMNLQAVMAAVKRFEMTMPQDPSQRTFGGFARGPDGRFSDDDLVNSLATAIEQPGGAFGAQNVPRIMKPVEILGIIRGRKWNLAGLNEFRKHFGLKAYETFEDINSDPAVADQLRNLYQHPDHVELYPGLVAEEAKTPMVPGVGIAPTYTISRVVLSDAVSLVRGDRYYTTDYHPGYLTQWGYNEANYDVDVNHGCVFYKLFMRAFPNHFKRDSVYAHYPMVIPPENRKILTNLGRVERFNFDRPQFIAPPVHVSSYAGAKYVFSNDDKYRVNWQEGLDSLMGRAGRGRASAQSGDRKHLHSLLNKDDCVASIKSFYSMIAESLLAEKSHTIAGKAHCDVVRDVGNLAHTHFVARMFNLPLKSTENPKGVFSEQELYTTLATMFASIFLDLDPVKSFPLRQKAKEMASRLGSIVETNAKLSASLGIGGFFTGKPKDSTLSAYGVNLIKGLSKAGLKPHEITWDQILPTAGALVPNEAQLVSDLCYPFALAVDFYLSPGGQPHLEELHRIASRGPSEETDALLLGYAMEGIRMAGPSGIYREVAAADAFTEDDGREVNVQPGDRVFVSFASAARDGAHFTNPDTIDPRRPLDSYINYGAEPHMRLGREVSQVALVELFRALFRKKGLRRVSGPQGELKRIPGPGGYSVFMTEDWGGAWPFPASMKVIWDGA